MEINKTNKVLHCTSCNNKIEPGQAYTCVPFSETKIVINEHGELEGCKSDGYRVVCEYCGEAWDSIFTTKF